MPIHRVFRRCYHALGLGFFALLVGVLSTAVTHAQVFSLSSALQNCAARYGSKAGPAVQHWYDNLQRIRNGDEQSKLHNVNDYVNRRVTWADDQTAWGQYDYWATPVESFVNTLGDCEDFAIAKYFSLKFSGVPVSRLRITYVKAQIGGAGGISQAHMVLAYYATPDAVPLVLDNLVPDIRPASSRPDLTPVFSFNTEGVWAAGARESRGGAGSISRWADLLNKMRAEGIEP